MGNLVAHHYDVGRRPPCCDLIEIPSKVPLTDDAFDRDCAVVAVSRNLDMYIYLHTKG